MCAGYLKALTALFRLATADAGPSPSSFSASQSTRQFLEEARTLLNNITELLARTGRNFGPSPAAEEEEERRRRFTDRLYRHSLNCLDAATGAGGSVMTAAMAPCVPSCLDTVLRNGILGGGGGILRIHGTIHRL